MVGALQLQAADSKEVSAEFKLPKIPNVSMLRGAAG